MDKYLRSTFLMSEKTTAVKHTFNFVEHIASSNQNIDIDSIIFVDGGEGKHNNGGLSQMYSVSPQRHCGFFMPIVQQDGSIATLCRVDTPKCNTRKGNMGGGTIQPRVKPDTLTISTVSGVSQSNV